MSIEVSRERRGDADLRPGLGGIKDSALGYEEGVREAMKSFTNVKTCSLPRN